MLTTKEYNNLKAIGKLSCLFSLLLVTPVLLMVLVVLPSSSYANSPKTDHLTPAEVVQRFCQLDANGNRLNSMTWRNISPLVAWTNAIGDFMFIISNFKIGKTEISGSSAIVSVEYEFLGSTRFISDLSEISEIDVFSERMRGKHTTIFSLWKEGGAWKIYGPMTAPHVHWKTAIAHIRDIARSEPARNAQLEDITQTILKARDKYEAKK
jgi:hypothetical protein